MAIPDNSDRINAIALELERRTLSTLQQMSTGLPDVKSGSVELRSACIAALDRGGAEPLAGILVSHVAVLAALLDPTDPLGVLDRLEASVMGWPQSAPPEAMVPISLAERAAARAEALAREVAELKARVAELEGSSGPDRT